jgi:DNA-binding beta-propeller fold protein YncE
MRILTDQMREFAVTAVFFMLITSPVAAQTGAASDALYSLDQSFFKLPDDRPIGSTAGIAIAPDGESIWVFDRCGANNCVGSSLAPIMQFDLSGKLLKSFGANLFVRPHSNHVDSEGNVWVADGEGPNGEDPRRDGKGHQVFKFSPNGEVLMTLGKAGIAGDGPDELNQPSSVYVAPNGDIFVGDGHGGRSNARIMKFSSNGRFIKSWGSTGSGPGEFDTPHALAMDSSGRLFVGDRGNNRVQIFDQEGNFLQEWGQFGRPSGIYIDHNDILYVTDSSSSPRNNPGMERGIRIASVSDGKVFAFIDDPDEVGTQEGVVADSAGNVYGSLTAGMALRKYTKK